METLGTFLNKAGSLTEREVELGIVLIAHHWKGDYVYRRACEDLPRPGRAAKL